MAAKKTKSSPGTQFIGNKSPLTTSPASGKTVINEIASPALDVIALTDPEAIRFYVTSVADQMNEQRKLAKPFIQAADLSQQIADIVIETTAQGASLLEVHIIDPAWMLFRRNDKGVCFIDVDDAGYLWPPLRVNFPSDGTDCLWTLCQCRPTTDLSAPNVILTFEDSIVSQLREKKGPKQSTPSQTRAEFIQFLIDDANQHPANPSDVRIRFVNKFLDPVDFTPADLPHQSAQATQSAGGSPPPASSQRQVNPRQNPKKNPGVGSAISGARIQSPGQAISQAGGPGLFGLAANVGQNISLNQGFFF